MPCTLLERLETDALVSVVKHADVSTEFVAVVFVGPDYTLMWIGVRSWGQFC